MFIYTFLFLLIVAICLSFPDKTNDGLYLKEHRGFLNFGDKKLSKWNKTQLENTLLKSKVDVLGDVFRGSIQQLKSHNIMDLVFLIDASSSVGEENFQSELKFVKKFLSDVTVDINHTRVAIVTFGSPNNVFKSVDEISEPSEENNKCLLLNKELLLIRYTGGGTYTLGAFQLAKNIFKHSRIEAKKALFLITDGFSNGGDPVPVADELKTESNVTIFTLGIQNGNYKELFELASTPGETHSYLLDSFQEFESLARRALHADLQNGDYIPLGIEKFCDSLCEGGNCCDEKAVCTCGTSTGQYSCICQPGYYGSGLKQSCSPCPSGTYSTGPNVCLPCPDINHITTPPAIGLKSCTCKLGFQPTIDNKCEVTRCPELQPPQFGYFVKKRECSNVLYSACGMRCDVGYTLSGNSIRMCQQNGTWSGKEPTCHIRSCARIIPPAHGTMSCENPDLGKEYDEDDMEMTVDTVCSFKCGNGRSLVGSNTRTCLPIAQWDGIKTTCKQLKCPKVPKLPFLTIEPQNCTIGRQVYGKKCTFSCPDGFKLIGPSSKECTGLYGTWTYQNQSSCEDITPPELFCPKDIKIKAQPKKQFGKTSWTLPKPRDNSGLEVTLWTKPAIKSIEDFKFKVGKTTVVYYAQDAFKNVASCSFNVEVLDEEKPVIEDCVDPLPFLIETPNSLGDVITWDEPNIFDNSQQPVTVKKSHEQGTFFKIGTTQVTYTAIDSSNNTNTCVLNITVQAFSCDDVPSPLNGQSDCKSSKNCIITCEEGYAIPLDSGILDQEMINSSDNSTFVNLMCEDIHPLIRKEEGGAYFPDCSITQLPEEIIQEGEITLQTDKTQEVCSNPTKLEEFENEIKNELAAIHCEDCENETDDKHKIKATALCDFDQQSEEEKTNRIRRNVELVDLMRFQRSVGNNRISGDGGVGKKTKQQHQQHKRKDEIKIRFQLKAKTNGKNVEKKSAEMQKKIKRFGTLRGNKTLTLSLNETLIVCPMGFATKKTHCVQCPAGYFHNMTRNQCQSCRIGEYNDLPGQIACKKCPLHHSTRRLGAKNVTDCALECAPGTIARKRPFRKNKKTGKIIERVTLQPRCRSCPLGQFQDKFGQLTCIPCPKGFTTIQIGSVGSHQCIPTVEKLCSNESRICNAGKCVIENGYHSCVCPKNFIGSYCEINVNSCDSSPCRNGAFCMPYPTKYSLDFKCVCKEGFHGRLCENEIETCPIKCVNNGTCVEDEDDKYLCICPKGYGGDFCQIKIHHCRRNYCENGGRCVETYDGFKCICRNGYMGKRCNLLPCDYQPCYGNASCLNLVQLNTTQQSYMCECPPGYAGIDCTLKINYCRINPCLNNGKCISNISNYTCECSKLFYGKNCEHALSPNFILAFPRSSTTDYVKLQGFHKEIDEISTCFWMQTIDNFNYGTILSYATNKHDNAFTITDYTGIVIYINNKNVVSDVYLNDGLWHHFCFTWSSLKGDYSIYVDSLLKKNGTNFQKGVLIDPNGALILGQEQDGYASKFSQSESFMGKLAYLDVWSQKLNESEIKINMLNCEDIKYGDLYAWPEFQGPHIKGDVKILPSNFCKRCELEDPNLLNGRMEIRENKLIHYCNKGYELSGHENLVKGRACTKAGKWEGMNPTCKRKYCGAPRYLKNGYILGRSYYYGDKIIYRCFVGYNMSSSSNLRRCNEEGNWEPSEAPSCLGNYCEVFPKPRNSLIKVLPDETYEDYIEEMSFFDFGSTLEVTCEEGFKLNGTNPRLVCLRTGRWNQNIPRCIPDEIKQKIDGHDDEEDIKRQELTTQKSKEVISTTRKIFDKQRVNLTLTTTLRPIVQVQVQAQEQTTTENVIDRKLITTITPKSSSTTVKTTPTTTQSTEKSTSIPLTTPSVKVTTIPVLVKTTQSSAIKTTTVKPDISYKQIEKSSSSSPQEAAVSGLNPQEAQEVSTPPQPQEVSTIITSTLIPEILEVSTISRTTLQPDTRSTYSTSSSKPVLQKSTEKMTSSTMATTTTQVPLTTLGTTTVVATTEVKTERSRVEDEIVTKEVINKQEQLETTTTTTAATTTTTAATTTTTARTTTTSTEKSSSSAFNCDLAKIPMAPLNGYLDEESLNAFKNGSSKSIKYKCRFGHNAFGKNESECIVDGYWSDIDMRCDLIPCPIPPKFSLMQVKNDNVSTSGYFFGNMVMYECIDGYRMMRNNAIRCTATGKWSKMSGKCQRLSCFKPEVAAKTKIIGQSYLFEDKVTLMCPNKAKYIITCGSAGKWLGKIGPECL